MDRSALIEKAQAWREGDPDPEARAELDRLLAAGDFAELEGRPGCEAWWGPGPIA